MAFRKCQVKIEQKQALKYGKNIQKSQVNETEVNYDNIMTKIKILKFDTKWEKNRHVL